MRRKELGGGGRSYSADFHPCKRKKKRPLPVRRSRHKIKEGKLKWEESKHRGKEEEALPGRGLDKASLFRLEGPE